MAAGNGKVVEFFRFDAVQIMKNIGLDTAKPGAIGIDATFTGVMVKMNAPTTFSNQAQVQAKFFRSEVIIQVRTVYGIEVAASSTLFNTTPCGHRIEKFYSFVNFLRGGVICPDIMMNDYLRDWLA
jgi:hypothetical protein